MKNKDFLKKLLLAPQKGIALLMVISSIAIMSFLMSDLMFETELNKFKVYNLQDKLQAKLNAESGLNFAMAKLRLYKDAFNLLEKNKDMKSVLKPSMLEGIITQPFAYPIPLPEKASANQKSLLQEFEKSVIFKGKLFVTITPVSGFLNPNNMRIPKKSPSQGQDEDEDSESRSQGEEGEGGEKKLPHQLVEEELIEALKQSMDEKREEDEEFDNLYGNLRPELLVKEIKFYVNRPEDFNDSERAEIEAQYLSQNIEPKHAPMTSVDEMHLLLGWPDAMIELIKDRLTVHEVSIIPLNDLTKKQLKQLFPSLSKEQLEDFFKIRDGDKEKQIEPREFETQEDFKKVLVEEMGAVPLKDFEDRMKELELAGLRVGTAGKLFKVESVGEYERGYYKIVAFVDLPIKPEPPKKKKKGDDKDGDKDSGSENDSDKDGSNGEDDKDKEKKKTPMELLEPRVIEMRTD
ncbi:MAG: hypothetical protein ACPGJV_11060 [Bacteriovoracaceae bacterium]